MWGEGDGDGVSTKFKAVQSWAGKMGHRQMPK